MYIQIDTNNNIIGYSPMKMSEDWLEIDNSLCSGLELLDYKYAEGSLSKRSLTVQENNAQIQAQIDSLEKTLNRPLRELLSTSTSAETKNAAQTKVDEIEAQIETLRSQFVSIEE
jgi:polyhydroxyalkanoate synthesis regulator phasin